MHFKSISLAHSHYRQLFKEGLDSGAFHLHVAIVNGVFKNKNFPKSSTSTAPFFYDDSKASLSFHPKALPRRSSGLLTALIVVGYHPTQKGLTKFWGFVRIFRLASPSLQNGYITITKAECEYTLSPLPSSSDSSSPNSSDSDDAMVIDSPSPSPSPASVPVSVVSYVLKPIETVSVALGVYEAFDFYVTFGLRVNKKSDSNDFTMQNAETSIHRRLVSSSQYELLLLPESRLDYVLDAIGFMIGCNSSHLAQSIQPGAERIFRDLEFQRVSQRMRLLTSAQIVPFLHSLFRNSQTDSCESILNVFRLSECIDASLKQDLISFESNDNDDDVTWFSVPFEHAMNLLRHRRCHMRRGLAYFSLSGIKSVFLQRAKARIRECIDSTSESWRSFCSDPRMLKLCKTYARELIRLWASDTSSSSDNSTTTTTTPNRVIKDPVKPVDMIDHGPMCIRVMASKVYMNNTRKASGSGSGSGYGFIKNPERLVLGDFMLRNGWRTAMDVMKSWMPAIQISYPSSELDSKKKEFHGVLVYAWKQQHERKKNPLPCTFIMNNHACPYYNAPNVAEARNACASHLESVLKRKSGSIITSITDNEKHSIYNPVAFMHLIDMKLQEIADAFN